MTYLDYQATTPLASEVRDAMLRWLSGPGEDNGFANPSSAHRGGRAAAAAVEVARDQVAELLPTGGRVYFTSGATEAINWALLAGAADRKGGVAGLAIEHAAAMQCIERLGGTVLPVDSEAIALLPGSEFGSKFGNASPTVSAHESAPMSVSAGSAPMSLDEKAFPVGGLVSAMLVNNEVGTIQPVAALAEIAHRRDNVFLCDAVQAFGRIAIPVGPDAPDLIAVSAHKIHGPKGIGALWVREGIHLPPFMVGGAQEEGMRAGTVSPALCAGFGAAAALAARRWESDTAHVEKLWDIALNDLSGWVVNGSLTQRYRGNLNIRRDGVNAARILSDARHVAFSLGSACGSGSGKVSHVLRAMGLSEAQAHNSIRLGWGRYTSEEELREGLRAIKAAAALQGIN